ncbi:VOC family protein [uncultured Shimia sp.]|uniref:VOC family protein n=1 Tax=uncultured Shimia sp. TaxID=573152 RepID=UPI00262934FC|nr:VOC family protein [uncultured Shimia sp.]
MTPKVPGMGTTQLHSITPYFTVKDADLLIAFLTQAFNARIIRENRYEDGHVQHARLQMGDSVLMLNQSSSDYPPNTSQMHLYVDDVDTTHATALALGATSIMQPNDRPHGDRMAGLTDPCCNLWWVAAPIIA